VLLPTSLSSVGTIFIMFYQVFANYLQLWVDQMVAKYSLSAYPIFEHKRHDLENCVFLTPLVCCSIAPVLPSVCRVAQLCRVACLCSLAIFVQYLCNICVQETLSSK